MENIQLWLQVIELILKIIGGLTAIVLFIVGFKRYKKQQNWKRKEFVAKEIKEFYENKIVRNAMLMLDWDTRKIELYPENPEYDHKFVLIGRKELERALIPHGILKGKYTPDEAVIRDTFDYFLEQLTRFEHFIESDLVSAEDFKPYLRYWIDVVAEKLPQPTRDSLHHYILHYEYIGVTKLLGRFGKKIEPARSLEELVAELEKSKA